MKGSFSSTSSARTSSVDLFASPLVWLLFGGFLCATIFGLQLWINSKRAVFLRTASPGNTYTINLKGDKSRAFIIPNEVRADVFKLGQPFVSDIWLHSALDAFDLSFEAGFPDVRWLGESTVEFYRAQYFEDGMDSLLVSNKAEKSVKYLRVQSENTFLLFDMQSGTSISLVLPAPRGDSQWIAVEGAFTDGTEIPFKLENLQSTFEPATTLRI
jgi:hypothetical protein